MCKCQENDDTITRLKQFYNSSDTYLGRLKKHDERSFASYLSLIENIVPRGSLILDCGCGIGFSSCLLTERGFRVIGMDISELFIAEARKEYAEIDQDRLCFCVGDASKMPFGDKSFDAVCSFDLLEHVTDVEAVLSETARVTKTGGLCVVFMPNHLDPVQHIRWRKKDVYKPWEASSRIGAFYQAVRTTLLGISKALGLNRRIYYLKPVLSDDKGVCGEDFDATWLSNWFDIENGLKQNGFFIENKTIENIGDKIIHAMRMLRVPKAVQSFYIKARKSPCIIVGVKER